MDPAPPTRRERRERQFPASEDGAFVQTKTLSPHYKLGIYTVDVVDANSLTLIRSLQSNVVYTLILVFKSLSMAYKSCPSISLDQRRRILSVPSGDTRTSMSAKFSANMIA